MIRRPPRSTLFPYNDALPISCLSKSASVRPVSCSVYFLVSGTDRKSTRLNSSHLGISYAVFCLKKNGGAAGARGRVRSDSAGRDAAGQGRVRGVPRTAARGAENSGPFFFKQSAPTRNIHFAPTGRFPL